MYKEVTAAIKELKYDDRDQLDSLALAIRERALKDTRKVVELLHSPVEEDVKKASAVLRGIGDVAMTPLVESLKADSPEQLVWELQKVVEIQLVNRARIVDWLNKMLDDKRPVKPAELPPYVEERPLPRRVCDEAYLIMRRLFALEDDEAEMLNADAFLEMTDEDRDGEIGRARRTGKWTSLIEEER